MEFDDLMSYEYKEDPWINEILEAIRTGQRQHKDITLAECEVRDNRLYYRGSLVVPNSDPLRYRILELTHDAAIAGHPGRTKTYDIVQRSFYWPLMHDFVRRYVRACQTCIRGKPWHTKKQGVLRPLPVPKRRWCDISIDFVIDLPKSGGHTNVMVVVDRLSKLKHMIPLKSLDTIEVAECFIRNVFKHHGLPETMVSD